MLFVSFLFFPLLGDFAVDSKTKGLRIVVSYFGEMRQLKLYFCDIGVLHISGDGRNTLFNEGLSKDFILPSFIKPDKCSFLVLKTGRLGEFFKRISSSRPNERLFEMYREFIVTGSIFSVFLKSKKLSWGMRSLS